jgi:4-alpha-glucanotransferase
MSKGVYDEPLRQLAQRAGLISHWQDYRGESRTVAPETLRALLVALELPCASSAQIAESTARLETENHPPPPPAGEGRGGGERAFSIEDLAPRRRLWGLSAQLYALRREGDGGIGDFTALADLSRRAAAHGADAVAISPVHALFAADPHRFSPYSPSSRLFLNPLHVDPAQALGAEAAARVATALGIAPELRQLESLSLIDWPRAARARLAVLRALFDELRAARLAPGSRDPLAAQLRVFRAERGEALEDHARFEALHAHQLAHGGAGHWRDWPTALRDARGPAVAEFARAYAVDVEFHVFLQWLADRGLGAAHAAARQAGMKIGLIADLAVGTDGGGSHAWSRPHDLLQGVCVGAPPDRLNEHGQDWGLSTFSPRALRAHGHAPFREMLGAALRHAGGLRIDHVLGLNRLWLVPQGARATEGAYLKYPLDDLLRVTVQESRRHRAVIVGEDMGTVPEDFRGRMSAAGLMGLRVLWFQRDHGLFVDPSRWPPEVMATTTTHDLPTVAGWWRERDLDWRGRLGIFAADSSEALERKARARDRRTLWDAFIHAGVAQGDPPKEPDRVVDAAVRFITRAPSKLAVVPLEDLLGLDEQPNLPGTTDQHPNWQRRLPDTVESMLECSPAAPRLKDLQEER